MNILVQVFCEHKFFLEYLPRGETARSKSRYIFNSTRNCQTDFPSDCTILHTHQQNVLELWLLHILANTGFG